MGAKKADAYVHRPGHEKLWGWFGLSRASFCVLPRAFMHEMPDEWQTRMATLLEEWDAHWNWPADMPRSSVTAKSDGKFSRWPEFVLNYRHPDRKAINAMKSSAPAQEPR